MEAPTWVDPDSLLWAVAGFVAAVALLVRSIVALIVSFKSASAEADKAQAEMMKNQNVMASTMTGLFDRFTEFTEHFELFHKSLKQQSADGLKTRQLMQADLETHRDSIAGKIEAVGTDIATRANNIESKLDAFVGVAKTLGEQAATKDEINGLQGDLKRLFDEFKRIVEKSESHQTTIEQLGAEVGAFNTKLDGVADKISQRIREICPADDKKNIQAILNANPKGSDDAL